MPFTTQIDALLDTLGSGTPEEVETALQSSARKGDPSNGLAIVVGDGRVDSVVTWRYVRVTTTMYTQPDEDPYVGANNPTAALALTATYIQT